MAWAFINQDLFAVLLHTDLNYCSHAFYSLERWNFRVHLRNNILVTKLSRYAL